MMVKELFLEIGCEEIPAGFIPRALAEMEAIIRRELESARLASGSVRTLGTPRRLALVVTDIPAVQPDAEITAMGPAKRVAFDADGKPTKAGEKLAFVGPFHPELVAGVQYSKGPYFADQGDFATAGAANINYATSLDRALVRAMALRAKLAEDVGDTATARAWARAVVTLWSGADSYLQTTVREMARLAR